MSNTQSSEFLDQARKVLNDEYKQAHSNEYNAWLSNHKNAWMQPHTIIPFPPFVVNSLLAPFKSALTSPTESDIVARALELYKQAHPAPVDPVATSVIEDPVVEEPVADAVLEELIVEETIVEEIKPPLSGKLLSPTVNSDSEIHNIFQPIDDTIFKDTTFESFKQDLDVVPQPSDELNKVDETGKSSSTFFQKLKDKWITK